MSAVLYMQTDKNVRVDHRDIRLQDVAALSCSDPAVLARMQTVKICTIREEQYGRYPVAVSDILQKIQKEDPKVEIVHLGEPNFILTFERPEGKKRWMQALKVVFVCLVTFFGTAFSIMMFPRFFTIFMNPLRADLMRAFRYWKFLIPSVSGWVLCSFSIILAGGN